MTTALKHPAVVEYIRSLSAEEKDTALVELVQEAIRETGGKHLLPVRSSEGESLGYYVPPLAAQKHFQTAVPTLTEEDRERTRRALADLSNTFDVDDFLSQPVGAGRG